MNLNSINNNYSTSFKARLPEAEVKCLIQEAKQVPAGLPKLYTLLNFLDKIPTSYLNFTKTQSNTYFLVDKNSILGIAKNKMFVSQFGEVLIVAELKLSMNFFVVDVV